MFLTPRIAGVFCLAAALIGSYRAQAAPKYNDGKRHTLSSSDAFIDVFDDPTGIPTTLTVATEADIAFINLHNQSIGKVVGGAVSHYYLYDGSMAHMTGGEIGNIVGAGASEVDVAGGLASHIRMTEESRATFRGGEATFFTVFDEATATILGGSLYFANALGTADDGRIPTELNGSLLTISGGQVAIANAGAGGVIEMLGGQLASVNLTRLGTINVSGGFIGDFTLNPESETNIYGSNFALTLNSFIHSTPQYTLTGLLEDGRPLNARVSLSDGAELNLITVPDNTAIPEPSTLASLGMGALATILGMGIRARRSQSR